MTSSRNVTLGLRIEVEREHRMEPIVIHVDVDSALSARWGLRGLYDTCEERITELENAVPVIYDVLGSDGSWTCSDPDAEPMSVQESARLASWVLPGCRVYREPTPEQADELARLAELRNLLEALEERQRAAFGEAFAAAVLATLDQAHPTGQRLPTEVIIEGIPGESTDEGRPAQDARIARS